MKALIEQPEYVPDNVYKFAIKNTRRHLAALNKTYMLEVRGEILFKSISDVVCEHFGQTFDEVYALRKDRHTKYKIIRQMLVYFLTENLHNNGMMRKQEISARVGYRGHASGLYHHELVKTFLEIRDKYYINLVAEIDDKIKNVLT